MDMALAEREAALQVEKSKIEQSKAARYICFEKFSCIHLKSWHGWCVTALVGCSLHPG
jgi:hypothetical protein